MSDSAGPWRTLAQSGRRMFRQGSDMFIRHDLLSYASAIAFQTLFALVPAALALLALLGFLNLEEVWEDDLAPAAADRLQEDAFAVLERTVESILGERRGLWLTFGAAFALWQVSGAIRAASGPLNLIYDTEGDRPFWKRLLVSFALAAALAPLIVSAGLLVQAGPATIRALELPLALELVLRGLRWPAAGVLLVVAVYLVVRILPAKPQTWAWAGVGSVFVAAAWLVASLGFGLYASYIADYGTVFGSLASIIVLMTYLYVAAVALLFGVVLDKVVRDEIRRRTGLGRPG